MILLKRDKLQEEKHSKGNIDVEKVRSRSLDAYHIREDQKIIRKRLPDIQTFFSHNSKQINFANVAQIFPFTSKQKSKPQLMLMRTMRDTNLKSVIHKKNSKLRRYFTNNVSIEKKHGYSQPPRKSKNLHTSLHSGSSFKKKKTIQEPTVHLLSLQKNWGRHHLGPIFHEQSNAPIPRSLRPRKTPQNLQFHNTFNY